MIRETFSERQARAEGRIPQDVVTHSVIQPMLRKRLRSIIERAFEGRPGGTDALYDHLWNQITRSAFEAVYNYQPQGSRVPRAYFTSFIQSCDDLEVLDLLDVFCFRLFVLAASSDRTGFMSKQHVNAIFDAINDVFRRCGCGYQVEGGQIMRVDTMFTHSEIVRPALALLVAPLFAEADREFREAHAAYRDGRYKDCNTACGRAFESAMKAICDDRGLPYKSGDRASELIAVVRAGGLFTHDFDRGLDTFVAMLRTGLPDVRNKAGAHGQGEFDPPVTQHLAQYALNLAATNLLFLAQCHVAPPRP